MARQRIIVGLGEVVLAEHPEAAQAAGLAAIVAMQAVRLGHVGIVVSRVGQDRPGQELIDLLRDAGVSTSHVQWDPDLPTGRVIVRADGSRVARYLEERAAFDNLQWDFDLEDVAQEADAVVFGLLSRRSGQTRSEENRFLAACRAALKVLDLTNRGGGGLQRLHATAALEIADAAVVDAESLRCVLPAAAERPRREGCAELLRDARLSFVIDVQEAGDETTLSLHGRDGENLAVIPTDAGARAATLLAIIHLRLRGADLASALGAAAQVGAHVAAHPDERVPEELLETS